MNIQSHALSGRFSSNQVLGWPLGPVSGHAFPVGRRFVNKRFRESLEFLWMSLAKLIICIYK
jgi:hypothetical protein